MDIDFENCKLCSQAIINKNNVVKLREKGAAGVNEATLARGGNIFVNIGDSVHKSCRSTYINKKYFMKSSSEEKNGIDTRLHTKPFNFQTNCYLCTYAITERNKQNREYSNVFCKTDHIKDTIENIFREREMDEWALEVKCRVATVHCLCAEKAVYHKDCNTRFRTNKKRALVEERGASLKPIPSKRGRHSNENQNDAFLQVAKYLEENDDEQNTVNDLYEMMGKLILEGEEPYTKKWLKEKLIQRYGDELIFTNIQGRPDIVTFRTTANKILKEYKESSPKYDPEEENLRLIEAAAKIIKNDIKKIPENDSYPSYEDQDSIEKHLEYIPKTLRKFLGVLAGSKTHEKQLTHIGHALIQFTRPKTLVPPLQLALALMMHHHFGSKFLNESLHAAGFASSYKEVCTFERNAAVTDGINLNGLTDNSFLQFVGDNVDHNVRTIDGQNTLHCMGTIAITTSWKKNIANGVQRKKVSDEEILEIGGIERHFFSTNMKKCKHEKFDIIAPFIKDNQTSCLDFIWSCAWLLSPNIPLWTGFMETTYKKGKHPGVSTVIFLPMIDMPPSDYSCILSTMEFISAQAKNIIEHQLLRLTSPCTGKQKRFKCGNQKTLI